MEGGGEVVGLWGSPFWALILSFMSQCICGGDFDAGKEAGCSTRRNVSEVIWF